MSLTVSQVESVLISRRGAAIVAACLSTNPSGDASPRAYLGESIANALEMLNLWTADPSVPTDAEVGRIANGKQRRMFLDAAEYRLMETCLGNYAYVSFKKGAGDGQDLSDFRTALMADCDRKLAFLAANYPELCLAAPKGK